MQLCVTFSATFAVHAVSSNVTTTPSAWVDGSGSLRASSRAQFRTATSLALCAEDARNRAKTDIWEGYHRLIPESQLFTGKDLTVPIEQNNSNIRHFLARFRRRTKVVSKAVEMVDLSLRIYHRFHDNLDAFAAKAAVLQSIFG